MVTFADTYGKGSLLPDPIMHLDALNFSIPPSSFRLGGADSEASATANKDARERGRSRCSFRSGFCCICRQADQQGLNCADGMKR
mmetsp:Transcript_11244/g.41968  ORF Transcript_11244/g.41968 Transcript_11244/m.41968 type:complete len:85 (-) Transcript_11244:577-831(-)|eukprot:scaffold7085_cov329-Pinguiococcus_pyrenoidosus.AAC.5